VTKNTAASIITDKTDKWQCSLMMTLVVNEMCSWLPPFHKQMDHVHSFVRYCREGYSLLWTPALRPYVGPMC